MIVAPTVLPVADEFLNSFNLVRERSHDNSVEYVKEAMSKGMPFLSDKPVEFNMAMSCVILRPKIRTILVSPKVTEAEARTMGLEYAPSVEEGLRLLESLPRGPGCHISIGRPYCSQTRLGVMKMAAEFRSDDSLQQEN